MKPWPLSFPASPLSIHSNQYVPHTNKKFHIIILAMVITISLFTLKIEHKIHLISTSSTINISIQLNSKTSTATHKPQTEASKWNNTPYRDPNMTQITKKAKPQNEKSKSTTPPTQSTQIRFQNDPWIFFFSSKLK